MSAPPASARAGRPSSASGDRRRGAPATGRPGGSPRLRGAVLAQVALLPVAVSYACCVVLAGVTTSFASGTTPGGEPGLGQAVAVGVPLWLATHLVPLRLSGVPFGVLPLLPVVAVALLTVVVARRGVRRLGGRWARAGVPVVATAAAAQAASGVFAAALLTPDAVVDASPALAGLTCGALGAAAAVAGVADPCGLLVPLRRLPVWLRGGLRAGLLAVVLLLGAGAALLTAALLADAAAVAAVFTRVAPEAGSGAGLLLLSIAYLPNAVVAGASWVMGPGVTVGAVSASPTVAVAGLLPPLPLAAALPDGPPPSWAGMTFAVPLAVGSVVGWKVAPLARDAATRLRALAVAAVTAAVVLAAFAALSGGRLGVGPFDPVSVPILGVLLAVLAWVAVPGAVVAMLAIPTGTAARRPAPRRGGSARTGSRRRSKKDATGGGRTTGPDRVDDGRVETDDPDDAWADDDLDDADDREDDADDRQDDADDRAGDLDETDDEHDGDRSTGGRRT